MIPQTVEILYFNSLFSYEENCTVLRDIHKNLFYVSARKSTEDFSITYVHNVIVHLIVCGKD